MTAQTIKVSLQSIEIPAINIYVHIISTLIVLALAKWIFGNLFYRWISFLINWVRETFIKESYPNWIACCRERKYWSNKQDALGLNLKGNYIKTLNFSVTVVGKPAYWRAGFVMGNEKLKVNEIVDTINGITIHTGSDYEKREKLLPVWKYYDNYERENPDFCSVKFDSMGERVFSISITDTNFIQVKIQGEVVFAQKIDPSFRRRVYLKAWADTADDCQIKFKNISYTLYK